MEEGESGVTEAGSVAPRMLTNAVRRWISRWNDALVQASRLVILVAAGCGTSAQSGDLVRSDSAGVVVLEWTADESAPVPEIAEAGIVAIAGADDTPIGNVRDVLWIDSAHVVYGDDDMSLHLIDAFTGEAEMIGRRGRGPGEFEDIAWIARGPDGGFSVYDPGLGRLSAFSTAGEFIGVTHPETGDGRGVTAFMDAVEGRLVGVRFPAVRSRSARNATSEWGAFELEAADETGRFRTIGEVLLTKCRADRPDRCSPDPGTWSGVVAGAGGSLAVSWADWPEVRLIGLDGTPVLIFRGAQPASGYSRLFVDVAGRIWFGRVGEDTWHVLHLGERRVRAFRLPERFRLHDSWGETGVGVLRDSLGVQRIAVVPLDVQRR